MTYKIVLENFKYKPARSLLSVLLIGVPVTLILCLVGISQGMLSDASNRARGIGADIWIRPPDSSLLTLSGAGIPEKMVPWVQQQPQVKMAVGMVTQPVSYSLFVAGINLANFRQMSGGFRFLEGGPFRNPDDVIVDEYYARQENLHVGSRVTLLNRPWHVCGIIEAGKLARIVLPIQILQSLTGNTGKVSQIFVKTDNPNDVNNVIAELKQKLPDYKIYSMEAFISLYSVNNIPGLRAFINVVIAIGIVIGFAVVCLSMYMAVLQRTREIGILKSLGASKGFILSLVLAEAFLIALGGTVLGILLSFGAKWIIFKLAPAFITQAIVPSWWPISGAITLVGALLGALYPGLSAAGKDPIEALAYE